MRFVLKALFFLAVVAAFIPRQPDAEAAPSQPETASPDVALDLEAGAGQAAGEFCERQPALCQTVQESAAAARFVGDIAVQQARQAIVDATAQPARAPADALPAS